MFDVATILALSSTDARDWARASNDAEALVAVRDAALADDSRPRRSLLAAIELRLATLARASAQAEEAGEVVRDDAAPLTVEQIASINDVPVEVVSARLAETVAAPDTNACARAFITAMMTADNALMAAMIDDVRRNGVDSRTLAVAMTGAYHDIVTPLTQPRPAHVPKRTGTPGDHDAKPTTKLVDRVRQMLADDRVIRADDGSIIVPLSTIATIFGERHVWFRHPGSSWTPRSSSVAAAAAAGWTVERVRHEGERAIRFAAMPAV